MTLAQWQQTAVRREAAAQATADTWSDEEDNLV